MEQHEVVIRGLVGRVIQLSRYPNSPQDIEAEIKGACSSIAGMINPKPKEPKSFDVQDNQSVNDDSQKKKRKCGIFSSNKKIET